jgi:hypothetical protein
MQSLHKLSAWSNTHGELHSSICFTGQAGLCGIKWGILSIHSHPKIQQSGTGEKQKVHATCTIVAKLCSHDLNTDVAFSGCMRRTPWSLCVVQSYWMGRGRSNPLLS